MSHPAILRPVTKADLAAPSRREDNPGTFFKSPAATLVAMLMLTRCQVLKTEAVNYMLEYLFLL